MNTDRCEIVRGPDITALARWENEGGAPGGDAMDIQYGRRVETDRSWTVYHVFTGVPARADGLAMIGMSHSDATKGMLSLNLLNARRRRERTASSDRAQDAREPAAGES